MRRLILTWIVSGFLVWGGFPVLAEEMRPTAENLAKPQMQIKLKSTTILTTERRGLQPLSDEELGQITAGGLGPVINVMPSYFHTPITVHPFVNEGRADRTIRNFYIQRAFSQLFRR